MLTSFGVFTTVILVNRLKTTLKRMSGAFGDSLRRKTIAVLSAFLKKSDVT